MKLQSTRNLKNTKCILPTLGEMDIDAFGQIEIDDAKHANLIDSLVETGNWEEVVDEELEEGEEGEEETESEEEELSLEELLNQSTLADMVAMAKKSKLKGWEKFKNSKVGMRTFLKKQLK